MPNEIFILHVQLGPVNVDDCLHSIPRNRSRNRRQAVINCDCSLTVILLPPKVVPLRAHMGVGFEVDIIQYSTGHFR